MVKPKASQTATSEYRWVCNDVVMSFYASNWTTTHNALFDYTMHSFRKKLIKKHRKRRKCITLFWVRKIPLSRWSFAHSFCCSRIQFLCFFIIFVSSLMIWTTSTTVHLINTVWFSQDVSDLIGYKKLIDLRKREVLHKQWQKSVYRPIQREIRREMNSSNYADLSRRKRELHKEYIEHVNRKVGGARSITM